ncbi:chemotaxis protein CheW [Nitrincola nitratireducens]|uniref:Chemotaxis protein CheW n=1 Tax=Nitrincola nitratireducens TaxID=1229521 RepID=W9UYR9_9GAMM|nr:chemotaxis protein CheW [Nitrincola nitratireducens]EXJ12239.1 Chemotaxis protein CheW [Nitrincola nitratireducens]
MTQKKTTDDKVDKIEKIQILSFVLDQERFGVEISNIQEVLEYRSVTPVPRTPTYMLGVINLRGQVVPVIDLRSYFNMQLAAPTVNSCIIIVDVKIEGEETSIGLLADSVQEVVELNVDDISPPPKIGSRIRSEFIYGMVKHDEYFIILLRVSRIFSQEDLTDIQDVTVNVNNLATDESEL